MKTKSQKFLDIFSIVCAIVLFVGLIALSVFVVKFSIEQIENTCYADSTNGVVENNLLLDNNFDIGSSSGQGWINDSNWWLGQSNSQGTFNNKTLSGSNSSGYVNIRQWCDGIVKGVDLHFRVQSSAHTGNWLVQVWLYNDKNGTPSQGYTTGWFDAVYREGTFQIPSNYNYAMFVIQCRQSLTLDYVKLEYGTSFTGYVPKNYENYGYDQGFSDGQVSGYNQYLDNYAIIDYLNVDEYISVGGFSFVSNNVDYDVLLAKDVENHTRTGNEGVATIYDSLLANVNYNIIYTQGSFPSVSSTVYNGVAGFYGVKVSLQFNAINNFIAAGTPFSLNMVSARANIDRTSGLYREVPFNIAFLTSNGEFVTYDYSLFFANNYYINNVRVLASDEYNETILGDTLNSGEVHYYRLPYDIYGIFLGSTHETGDYYHAYNIKLQFLPNGDYQSAYDQGFIAGQSDVNTQSFYNHGYNVGYDAGHRDGVLENTDYSFLGLIGAVFDAPIQAFSGLLDFNLLGVNLKSFVLAMLSLSVIIIVIKIALGGS